MGNLVTKPGMNYLSLRNSTYEINHSTRSLLPATRGRNGL